MNKSSRRLWRSAAWALIIAGLVLALFYRTLCWLVNSWRHDPYYSHGFLVPLVSGFLAWRRRGAFQRLKPAKEGVIILGGGLVLPAAILLHLVSL